MCARYPYAVVCVRTGQTIELIHTNTHLPYTFFVMLEFPTHRFSIVFLRANRRRKLYMETADYVDCSNDRYVKHGFACTTHPSFNYCRCSMTPSLARCKPWSAIWTYAYFFCDMDTNTHTIFVLLQVFNDSVTGQMQAMECNMDMVGALFSCLVAWDRNRS